VPKSKTIITNILTFALLTITLAITPLTSYDPINIPRLILLICFSFVLLTLLIHSRSQLFGQMNKVSLINSLVFIVWAFLAAIASNGTIFEKFFGVSGRLTGFITYIGLVVLMLSALATGGQQLNKKLMYTLVISGAASMLLALIQAAGADPFDWISEFTPIFSVFGNPNFLSSFMAFTAIAVLALWWNKSIKGTLISIVFGLISIFIIYKSKSQQGFLVLLIGISTIIYLWIRQNSSLKKLKYVYQLLWLTGGIAVFLDILQKSPWTSILYKQSVSFRGDFWQAGWKMALDNPIFGVGLDGYRDNFRFYRDQAAVTRDPIDASVDSAHNVFIDILAGGGFPLLALYLGWIFIVFRSAYKVFNREQEFNPYFAGIFTIWICYLAQSFISINTISLAIWGWALGGAIIGYEINSLTGPDVKSTKNRKYTLVVAISFIFGLIITMPIYITDAEFRSAHKSGDVERILESHEKWPQDVRRMNATAEILRVNGFPDQALSVSRKATELAPDNYEAWKQLWLNPNISEEERTKVRIEIGKLDPLNNVIK
jgi:O-antigen ligase